MLGLLLMAALVAPGAAGAQDSGKARKKIPVRVVTPHDTVVGVRVVLADSDGDGARATDVPVTTVLQPGVRVTFVPAQPVSADQSTAGSADEPVAETWLTPTVPERETWLTGPSPTPDLAAATSVDMSGNSDPAVGAPASRLVGIQHYLESTSGGLDPASAEDARPAGVPVTLRGSESGAAATFAPARSVTPTSARPIRESTIATSAPVEPPAAAGVSTYRLGPGDELDVHVWRNEDLTRRVPVRPDGLISLPLVGELRAAGKTAKQLEDEITTLLEQFVQYPTVTVTVTEVRSLVIYVLGRVGRPGTIVLDRPVNVVQAIAMAGGMQEFADRNGVVVMRTVNGQQVRLPFPYGDVLKGKASADELILQSGDVVYVP